MKDFEAYKKDYQFYKPIATKKWKGFNTICDKKDQEIRESWDNIKNLFEKCGNTDSSHWGAPKQRKLTNYDLEEFKTNLNRSKKEIVEHLTYTLLHTTPKAIETWRDNIAKYDTIRMIVNSGVFEDLAKSIKVRKSISTSREKWQDIETNLYLKAKLAWLKENPLTDGSPAIWYSKNGERDVTIIKMDEPNHRAKINTDKGATMYVPLQNLRNVFNGDLT